VSGLPRRSSWASAALLALAVLVYVWGLGGRNIPANGDEMVYAHIARLTAASGHWLPLVSELDHMRNTKPPLLFWQAVAATDWGTNWNLWALRLPSLLYTLATASLCVAMAWRITASRAKGLLAGAIYLAFLSSFRYGRPYLTSAAESFWLSLPMCWLVWRCGASGRNGPSAGPAPFEPGWGLSIVFGLALGLGAGYKSFALIAPACAAFGLALVWVQGCQDWSALLLTGVKVALMAAVGLAVFGLWFAFDPDPAAVWREFVVGENAAKLGQSGAYWQAALSGSSSIWVQALAYMVNAGLLALLLPALVLLGLKPLRNERGRLSEQEQTWPGPWRKVLLAWLLVWLVVFCIPSTRSARYVIPAMPALAVLFAVHWQQLGRAWFVATLALVAPCLLVLGRIAWVMTELGAGDTASAVIAGLAFAVAGACVIWALLRPANTRQATLAACLMVFTCFNATVAPLDGAAGQFNTPAARQLQGQRIAVPSGFNAQFERYQFLLPGNRLRPYPAAGPEPAAARLPELLSSADAVVWALAVDAPQPCAGGQCKQIDCRWDIQGRQAGHALGMASLWYPQQWLLRRECLLGRL